MEPYTILKRRIRYSTHGPALRLHLKRPHNYRPIPHLDPALRARLVSALQRPDLKPTTRAKIKAVLHGSSCLEFQEKLPDTSSA